MTNDNIILCRCEDVSVQDIHNVVAEGYHTLEEIKRVTRVGMGPCQGRSCLMMILRELSIITNQPIENLLPDTYRPPTKSVSFDFFVDNSKEGGSKDDF